MKKFLFCIMLFVFLLLLAGCPQQVTDPKKITITSVGWHIHNIDSTFFTSSPPSHAFYSFDIHYSGSDISASDISSIRVNYPNSTYGWSIDPVKYLDSANKVIDAGLYYDSSYNTLPIGDLKIEIKLKNNLSTSFIKNIPIPGSTTAGTYSQVHTPEEITSPPSYSASLIKRATNLSGIKSTSLETLSIIFRTDDSRVYNGWVWIYDSGNNYVGASTKKFRNYTDGNFTDMISSLNLSGTADNTISLNKSDITFDTGKSFSDISKFIVILSDGSQYAAPNKHSYYDCRSISKKTGFTINP